MLQLQQLLPVYFNNDQSRTSELWRHDIVIHKGEYVKIVAPSGSGKTSLTHFLYGLRNEYNGHILFNGRNLRSYSAEDWAAYRAGQVSIVFQDLRLFPDLTVEQNIELKRQLNPFHEAGKIKEMAERLGIGNKLQALSRTCSYGEQQRVAIIRSLMQPYDLLLLDEPFSHLDDANAQKAMQLMLEESKARNAAIIFADLERIDYFPFTRLFHL
jgi:ABC-type antimicrobial peptide transport system, ATPase component